MSEPQDMVDSQVRNEFGMPLAGWVHRGNGGVYAPVDASTNRALPWVAVACIMAGIALGVSAMLGPLTDAKVERVKAEIRAEFADRIAKQDAYIEVAKYEASLAKTIAQRLDEKDKARSKP